MNQQLPPPPSAHQAFVKRFPQLNRAWNEMADAGKEGPLDEQAQRLVKLAIAAGAMREGGVHSGVRKALAAGASVEAIEQVVALAASTLGMPATVAVYSWVRDVLDPLER